MRWQEILTDTLLLCQEILFSQVSGVANFMGACQGSLSLVVALFGATKSCRGGGSMKLRSFFDKPEKRRLCICQKLETALKLRKEQRVANLANSQLCETFKSKWWTVLGVLHLEWRKSLLLKVAFFIADPVSIVNLGHFWHLKKCSVNSTSHIKNVPKPLHIQGNDSIFAVANTLSFFEAYNRTKLWSTL